MLDLVRLIFLRNVATNYYRDSNMKSESVYPYWARNSKKEPSADKTITDAMVPRCNDEWIFESVYNN